MPEPARKVNVCTGWVSHAAAAKSRRMRRFVAIAALIVLAAPAAARDAPQQAFLAALQGLCGQSFAGRVVTTDSADADFAGKPLAVSVECVADAVRMPFRVGEDRSRTWVVTRTADGLRLKHDHRHADGTPDEVTDYGGDTASPGTAQRQEFPADAYSKALFVRTGRQVSTTNVWAMEVVPGRLLAYELRRPNRHFRVEFDLGRPAPVG